MKILIYANVDGDFETLREVYEQVSGINLAICVGNFPLVSESTPLDKFYKDHFISEGQVAKQFMAGNNHLPAMTYAMYGEYDDPAIPLEEWQIMNMLRIQHFTAADVVAYDRQPAEQLDVPITKRVRVGFMGGYYSHALWGQINEDRLKRERSRKSLAICKSDIDGVGGGPLDFLFTFEAPNQYDGQVKFRGGTAKINELIHKTEPTVHFHAHMRDASVGYVGNTLSIGIPSLREGFYILDLYTGRVAACRPNLNEHLDVYENTKKSV